MPESGDSQAPLNVEGMSRAFGAANRARLLNKWFAANPEPTPDDAWLHVYRLLLWIDRTIGLAHCYESDKSQPGRPWYARSLAFHVWLSERMVVEPIALGGRIDWLFRRVIEELAASLHAKYKAKAALQRTAYPNIELPAPGEDAELEALLIERLKPWLKTDPPRDVLRALTDEVRTHLSVENKRKNLVGEGFEDVVEAIVRRVPGGSLLTTRTRALVHELPGFHPPRSGEKPKKVDLAILQQDGRRILVSAKWSVRADREEQFATDFDAYVRSEAANKPFDYVLVTNEFDPARLLRACERRSGNATLFTHVVHVNSAALEPTYGDHNNPSMTAVLRHKEEGRLMSLADWLAEITAS